MKPGKNILGHVRPFTPTNLVHNLWQRLTLPRFRKTLLSGLVTLGIVVLLLTQISITAVWSLFSKLSYNWIALAILLYFINNVGRAFRLRLLLPNQNTRFYKLLLIVNAYMMFSNILPARTGEFSLLYFLRNDEDIPLDEGSAALVVGRIMDYLAVAVIFIIGAWFSLSQLLEAGASQTTSIIEAALGTIVAVVIVLGSMVWWGRRLLKLAHWFAIRPGLSSSSVLKFVIKALDKIIAAFAAIHSFRRYVIVFLWSLGLWVTIFIRFYALVRALDLETTLLNTIVGSTFAVLSKSIPFVTFGGIGTHEAGWTIGFMLVGFNETTALSSGFAVNILTLITTIVIGVCSLWVLRVPPTSVRSCTLSP